jgi:transcriptional regulator with XRE-family HTH domain
VSGKTLGERLERAVQDSAEWRDRWGELAKKAGVSDRTLRRWREGKNDNARLASLEAIAGALKVPLAWLLDPSPITSDPRIPGARERALRLRDEMENLLRYLAPPMEPIPFESRPIVTGIEERGRKRARPAEPELAWIPLVAERVAAGLGGEPQIPEEEKLYAFRSDWAALPPPHDRTRYVLVRLGDESVADSMAPLIRPGSILLLDVSEGARMSLEDPRPAYCIVEPIVDPPPLAVKWAEAVHGKPDTIRLRSENQKYPEIYLSLDAGQRVQEILRGRVVWWATEA